MEYLVVNTRINLSSYTCKCTVNSYSPCTKTCSSQCTANSGCGSHYFGKYGSDNPWSFEEYE